MKRKYGDSFGFEVITEGSFVDEGFNISTIVIRLSCTAMNEWITLSLTDTRYAYRAEKEWEEYKAEIESKRKEWERKILDMLKFTEDTGYSITQAVSEIFTVVLFEEDRQQTESASGERTKNGKGQAD